MSGTRRLTASRVELLADEAIVGPTTNDIVLSAPAETRLGNNPAVVPFVLTSTNIPAVSGPVVLPALSAVPFQRYFSVANTNVPYHSRLTSTTNGSSVRLQAIFGLGLKGVVTFDTFLSTTALLAVPAEITFGLHGTDNLGGTWDKTYVVSIYDAPAAIGRHVTFSIPLCIPHAAGRTHIDFFADCNNPTAVILATNGSTITFDVHQ